LYSYSASRLARQFKDGERGTLGSQKYNIDYTTRPICIYLAEAHFTALRPLQSNDPFVPHTPNPLPRYAHFFSRESEGNDVMMEDEDL